VPPTDEGLRNKLFSCGFFGDIDLERETGGAVKLPRGRIRSSKEGSDFVRKDSSFEVEPEVARELIHFATRHLFGEERDFVWLQGLFVEVMQNTREHAATPSEREAWWVSVYVNEERKIARFNFIDNGYGLLRRIRQRWNEKFKKPIPWNSDVELLEVLLEGGLPSLKPPDRNGGNGWRHVNAVVNEGGIRNLVVISNKTVGRLRKNGYSSIKKSFDGTFLHWEIGLEQKRYTKNKST
jgi:hypothetical protein